MSKSRTASLKNSNGELSVSEHETDSPLLPAAQLERLHSFRPDLVDWVVKRTETESNWRRDERHRVNTFIFVERLFGQFCSVLIGIGAIAGAIYAGTHGAQVVGGAIATVGLGTLAVVFITGRKKSNSSDGG